jgi:hypothetical protein
MQNDAYPDHCDVRVFCNDPVVLQMDMKVADQCFIQQRDAAKVVKVITSLTASQKAEFLEGYNH